MKILAFDTSGEALVVALAVGGKIAVGEKTGSRKAAPTGPRHSASLIPELDQALRRARWKPEEIDVLAVGVGPGSFTGIRVGVMTAKILGMVWKAKIVGVSSLEAIAYAVADRTPEQFAVALDARKGKIYAALFEKKSKTIRTLVPPTLTTREEFFGKMRRSVFTAGDLGDMESPGIQASALIEAACEQAKARRFVTPEDLEPLYLHARDCNVTKKQ